MTAPKALAPRPLPVPAPLPEQPAGSGFSPDQMRPQSHGTHSGPGVLLGLAAALATCLTATSLLRVFSGMAWWYGPAIGGVLVATGSGLLGRLFRLPALLLPVAYAVGLGLYVSAVCAPDTRRWLLPTRATWDALVARAREGSEDVQRYAAPVPQRPGLVLLVILGVYVVAVAVDIITARLRQPAAAGLPLLALLAVPAAIVSGSIGTTPFVLSALGYLLLLLVEGRLAQRPLAGRYPDRGAAGEVGGSVLRAGAVAALGLAAALVLPSVLPTVGAGLIPTPQKDRTDALGGRGTGGGGISVAPLATLTQQLRSSQTVPLLRVRTDRPDYLRLTALDDFSGISFSSESHGSVRGLRVQPGAPLPTTGQVRTATATVNVTVDKNYQQHLLPVPYSPVSVSAGGSWRFSPDTSTVSSNRSDTGGLHYTATSRVPVPTPNDLRSLPTTLQVPGEVMGDLDLPPLDPRVRQLAVSLTAGKTTRYDEVHAIQQYFHSPPFVYDLNGAPTNSVAALETFLFDTHRGYCEQYAVAMTVLVRALGIPARVAIGFTPGSQQSDGSWVITNHDAHAWPEVWFPKAGWVRFEPTPRADTSGTTPDAVAPAPATDATTPTLPPAGGPAQTTTRAGGSPPAAATGTSWDLLGGVLLVVAAAGCAPGLVRWRRRRLRLDRARRGGTGGYRAAWREVVDTAHDLGLGSSPAETPRHAVARWVRQLGSAGNSAAGSGETNAPIDGSAAADSLRRLLLVEEQARFAGAAPVAGDAADDTPLTDARRVLAGLRRQQSWRARLRAVLLPASVLKRGGRPQEAQPQS